MKLENLANKEFEITEQGLLKVVEKKIGKFVPKEDEKYWFVTQYGEVLFDIYSNCEGSRWAINHYLAFRTPEEAKKYKHYLEVLDKYKHVFSDEEWEDGDIKKWVIKYFCDDKTLRAICCSVCKYTNSVYFKTVKDAQAFIEEAGEENVKKFMFDVWE